MSWRGSELGKDGRPSMRGGGVRQRDRRKGLEGFLAPIDYAPILGTTEVLDDVLESGIVICMRGLRELGKQSDSVTNVQASNNICIDKLTKYLPIGKADFALKSSMSRSAFQGARTDSL
jgi:hypothetical protein